MRTDRLDDTLLPRRLGLPVFASDALSSVAYAPDEILLTLALAGSAGVLTRSWQVTVAVALVMMLIIASYRQNVRAYPGGGGDYEVVSVNLGRRAGLGVGAALMIDYCLTVAVSVSAGVQNAGAALTFLNGYEVPAAAALVAGLALLNLRGVRESGRALAVPVYAFLAALAVLIGTGAVQWITGSLGRAPSADYELVPEPGYETLTAFGLALLLVRAFASGAVALTGVQGVSNGVPALRRPRGENAASILVMMATISIGVLLSVVLLAQATGITMAIDPQRQLRIDGAVPPDDFVQDPVLGQLATVVFGSGSLGLFVVSVCAGVMLVVAANTAFNGFPVLTARLARDGFLPRDLLARGRRLAYSNGIFALALVAGVLVVASGARVTALIHMYVVGVFTSFTLSQLGMVRHWNRRLRTELSLSARVAMLRSRTINMAGAVCAATVLTVVLLTRFGQGAALSALGIVTIWMVMSVTDKAHRAVQDEVALPPGDDDPSQRVPTRVSALVYLPRLDRATMRALSYARASRAPHLEAVTVDVIAEETEALRAAWEARALPVPLRILESPYREPARPFLDYVRRVQRDRPRELVVVYVATYRARRRWVHWLRDRVEDRLRAELLATPGVAVVTVPWQPGAGHSAPAGLPSASDHPR